MGKAGLKVIPSFLHFSVNTSQVLYQLSIYFNITYYIGLLQGYT